MTRKQALELATKRVLAVQLKELETGKMDQKTFDTTCESREAQIQELADEIMRPARKQTCASCKKTATTTIAGKGYCAAHAATAQRPELPAKFKAA